MTRASEIGRQALYASYTVYAMNSRQTNMICVALSGSPGGKCAFFAELLRIFNFHVLERSLSVPRDLFGALPPTIKLLHAIVYPFSPHNQPSLFCITLFTMDLLLDFREHSLTYVDLTRTEGGNKQSIPCSSMMYVYKTFWCPQMQSSERRRPALLYCCYVVTELEGYEYIGHRI